MSSENKNVSLESGKISEGNKSDEQGKNVNFEHASIYTVGMNKLRDKTPTESLEF